MSKVDDIAAAAKKKSEDEAALKKAAEAESNRIANESEAEVQDEDKAEAPEANDPRFVKAKAASENLRRIAQDYLASTPDEHVIFGRGGKTFTLGELRALFNL